jgi:hypothetical protein
VNRSSKWLVPVAAAATVIAGMAWAPVDASAQRRAVARPATRGVVVVAARPVRPVYVAPFVSVSPFWPHTAWYGGWYGGWRGWGPYYAQPYPYPYPYPRYAAYSSAARIQVQPSHAEVYVDGAFTGTVDSFDGWTQRLRVAPGQRELVIYLEGYETYRRHVLFRPGATITIQHEMRPLAAGEAQEARPTPSPRAGTPQPSGRRPGPPPPRGAAPPVPAADYGAIEIRVQPVDAEILVNGDLWESPEPGRLDLDVAEGVHRVEIRREGYRPYSADVRVVGGQVTTVNVSLSPE